VDLVRTDVSEEHIASLIRMTRIVELGAKLAVTKHRNTPPILVAVMLEAILSSETSVLRIAIRCHIPEYGIIFREI
jgi:hypothetical protein